MSMSTHVIGIKEPTEEYRKKYEAYRACEAAGVSAPKEVRDFFGGIAFKYVDPTGMTIALDKSCIHEWKADMSEGYEIEVAKIPEGVTRVRVYNSW
jgi:hypothetical protein